MLLALLSAGVGAFLGAYLKRKGQHLATKEDFDQLLKQIKAQTQATEDIKGEIQRELNSFSDVLERGRELAGFRRERIAKHLDQVLDAYVDIYAVAQLVPLRKWLYSNTDLETEARFRSALSRLRAHFGALVGLGVIPDPDSREFYDKDWRVLRSWDQVLSQAAYRTPEFRAEHPNSPAFSNEGYHEEWMKFMTQVENLGGVVKNLSRSVSIPH
jgi:hypothetical protein